MYTVSNMAEHLHPAQIEIGPDEQRRFIDKVREVAPYCDQPIDDFGAYETLFTHGDEEVCIQVPIAANTFGEDIFLDDAYRVMCKKEDYLNNEVVVVKVRSYVVRPEEQYATYGEEYYSYSTKTGDRLDVHPPLDLDALAKLHDFSKQIGLPVFNSDRLREILATLDELTPFEEA